MTDKSILVTIRSTTVTRHIKPGKPDSIKIIYTGSDLKEYPLWLSLDANGYAHTKAVETISLFGGSATTTEDALQEYPCWKKVVKIKVVQDGEFFRVVGWAFAPVEIKPKIIEQRRLDGGMNEERFWGSKDRKRSKKVATGLPVGYTDEYNEVG